MQTKSLSAISTFVLILLFTSIAFSAPNEASLAKTTFNKELTNDHSKKKRSFKKLITKQFARAKKYLAEKGIDLQDPTQKWLWYSIIAFVIGGLITIGGYILYLIGLGTTVNNNGPTTSTIGSIVLAYILLIVGSIILFFGNIAFYIWLAKILTDDSEIDEEN